MSRSSFYFTVPLQTPRRTPTPSRRNRQQPATPVDRWAQMAKVYARLVEQELYGMAHTDEARRWAHRTHVQIDYTERVASPASLKRAAQTAMLEGLLRGERKPRMSASGREARRLADEARRRIEDARRRAEQARLVREEFERMEVRRLERLARIARRAEEEARMRAEAQQRAEMEAAEEAARRRREAWRRYERRWEEIRGDTARTLRFASIPWPLLDTPLRTDDVCEAGVRTFVLSADHPEGATRRERIRDALRRWHPDKFGRQLARVPAGERPAVEQAAGVVVRVLNALAAEEGH
jgi:hypothetical protein